MLMKVGDYAPPTDPYQTHVVLMTVLGDTIFMFHCIHHYENEITYNRIIVLLSLVSHTIMLHSLKYAVLIKKKHMLTGLHKHMIGAAS